MKFYNFLVWFIILSVFAACVCVVLDNWAAATFLILGMFGFTLVLVGLAVDENE